MGKLRYLGHDGFVNLRNLHREIAKSTTLLSVCKVETIVNATGAGLLRLALNGIGCRLYLTRARGAHANSDIKPSNLVGRPCEYGMRNQIIDVDNDGIQLTIFSQVDIN